MTSHDKLRSRRLILLGSTGSIGINTLEVIEHLRDRDLADFEIVGMAAGSNATLLAEQARRYDVKHVAIADETQHCAIKSFKHQYVGRDAALELVNVVAKPGDLLVGAMVGSAGIPATLAAIELGCDIALANKETLVAAGSLVMPKAKQRGVNLLPIDSEHSAIHQCLEGLSAKTPELRADSREPTAALRRIVITASGGPFRTWSRDRMQNATVEEALNHPTWNMGPKITIDSASLMNKALEIIEAHWLFGLPADKIEVIIHPQSLIHSFVEFVDGSVISQLGPPDMRTPIQYALTWPERLEGVSRTMNWSDLKRMDFEQVDHEKFGALRLAYQVIETGGTAGAIFNAANEAAVAAFLDRKIPFGRITELVRLAIDTIPVAVVHTMNDVLKADQTAREFVRSRLAENKNRDLASSQAHP